MASARTMCALHHMRKSKSIKSVSFVLDTKTMLTRTSRMVTLIVADYLNFITK